MSSRPEGSTRTPSVRRTRGRAFGRARRVLVIALVALNAVSLVGASVLLVRALTASPSPAAAVSAPDLDGTLVTFDVPPSPGTIATITDERFRVPSVGLDVPLGTVTIVGDSVTPPGFDAVYLLDGIGGTLNDAADHTLFAVTHSVVNGRAPGNSFFETATSAILLSAGDVIAVGSLRYRVESTGVIDKTLVPARADVWADVPGRLVLITCLQKPDGSPSDSNLVIQGVLQP